MAAGESVDAGGPPVAVHDPAMVGLTVAFTLSIGAIDAAIVPLIPYLTDHGWTDVDAAVAAGLIGATQVAARVVFGASPSDSPPARLALVVLLVPVGGIVVLASSNGSASAWVAVALLGIEQGTSTLLRPLVLSKRLDPHVYGHDAARARRGAPWPEPSPPCSSPAPPGSGPRATRSGSRRSR